MSDALPAYTQLLDDLAGERAVTAAVLAGLADDAWDRPSPAEGWLLRDCVVHLAETDERAATIAEGEEAPFGRRDPNAGVLTPGMLRGRDLQPAAVYLWWQQAGDRMLAALRRYRGDERLPWAGRSMSVVSFTTARLMEHWSHGLDIHDAAGVASVDSDRLRHVAQLGFMTRDFAYRTNGLEPPTTPLRVELTAPSGAQWVFGPEDAPDRITGPGGDFCRVVTQRIHWSDTQLAAEGERAQEFLPKRSPGHQAPGGRRSRPRTPPADQPQPAPRVPLSRHDGEQGRKYLCCDTCRAAACGNWRRSPR